MRKTVTAVLLCAAMSAGSALAEKADAAACMKQPSGQGMRARMELMHEQMNRIEWTTNRAEQSKLLDIHTKHMQEGLRELRHRDMDAGCRMEVMGAIMEEMVRHQLVLSERDGH
jgi:hypothetical protein